MKRIIFFVFSIVFLFTACGTMQLADVARVSPGMSMDEVNYIMGKPVRILSSAYTEDGQIDVFEYRTYRNEAYAVEFINGRFSRYDFMYEDAVPPTTIMPNPAPVYPVRPTPPVRPTQPVYPTQPVRPTQPSKPQPNDRPGSNDRPNSNNSGSNKPGNNQNQNNNSNATTRPTSPTRPTNTVTRPTQSTTTRSATSTENTENKKEEPKKEEPKK